MINYFILSFLGIVIFFSAYQLLLKNEKWFQFNRFFLLAGLILSLVIPALQFNWGIEINAEHELIAQSQSLFEIEKKDVSSGLDTTYIKPEETFLKKTFIAIYWMVFLLLALQLCYRLHTLYKLTQRPFEKVKGFKIYVLEESKGVFSFFHFLFINAEVFQNKENLDTILLHEHIHRKQRHSVDNLFIEVVSIVFWFNPMIWLFKKAIKQNHEYLADQACQAETETTLYQNLILQFAQKQSTGRLVSQFSYPKLKNRIIMMNKNYSNQNRIWKGFLILFAFALFCTLNSFKLTPKEKPLIVIIDPGHGGQDHGTSVDGIHEKDLVLLVSEELKKQAQFHNIQLHFTRNKDEFIDLKSRVEVQKNEKADFYLSLHINAIHDANEKTSAKSGIEIYYSNLLTQKDTLANFYTAKTFAQSFSNHINEKVKFLPAPFYVLKEVNCPSILIECGFLSNEEDRKKLLDSAYREELAKAILLSIREIKRT